jgi:hypothetical protein
VVVPACPRCLSGLVHALEPVPGLTDFVVEAVSNAFGRLPDAVLLPWLPTLITILRSGGAGLAPPHARRGGGPAGLRRDMGHGDSLPPGAALTGRHPATAEALEALLTRA